MRRHATPIRGLNHIRSSFDPVGRFGRMFRNLPGASNSEADLEMLAAIMRGEGPDEDRKLDDPEPDEDENPNPRLPAGFTYFGQFVDHDLTFDPASSLERQNDPDALVDFRTPRFDLDSVYGRGPTTSPIFTTRADRVCSWVTAPTSLGIRMAWRLLATRATTRT